MFVSVLACCVMVAADAPPPPLSALPPPPAPAAPTVDANVDVAALLQASQQALEAAKAARDAALLLQKFGEAEAPKPPPPNWTFLTTGRIEVVKGNADTLSGGIDASASGIWRNWSTDFKLSYAYGQTWGHPAGDIKPTANAFAASARGERKYTETFGTYALLGFLMDRVASIQDQEYGELGAANAWLNVMHEDWVFQRLSTSVGFRATREAHGNFYPPAPIDPLNEVKWIYGPTITLNYRLGLSAHAFLTEDTVLAFDVQSGNDLRLNSDTAINVQLMSQLAIALNLKVRYIGQPVAGRKSTDVTIGSNVTWSW